MNRVRRPCLLFGVLVFAVAAGGLALLQQHNRVSYLLSKREVVRAALADKKVRTYERYVGPFDRARVTPLDRELQRVSFYKGHQLVLSVLVKPSGAIAARTPRVRNRLPTGSPLASHPLALAALAAAFVLATAAGSVMSVRNLDVLAMLAFLLPILLLAWKLNDFSVYFTYPPLLYLGARCLRVGLSQPRAAGTGRALLDRVTAGWSGRRRMRVLGMTVVALSLALTAITIGSGGITDVGVASMLGATLLAHGQLPYGHVPPPIIHGDTYPLLNYVAHIPAAWVLPVRDLSDNLDGALYVALAATLVTLAAMYWLTNRAGRSRETELRMMVGWLCFPPVLIVASSGTNDMLLAACIAVALATALHPGRSTLALAVGAWIKLVPLVVIPIWLARFRGRALLRATAALAAVSGGAILWLWALGGGAGLRDMLQAISFQFERGSLLSVWMLAGLKPLQPLAQAAVIGATAAIAFRVARDRALAVDPVRIAALVAAVIIGVQLTANYWTFAYLPWLFPPLALALLTRPEGRDLSRPRRDLHPSSGRAGQRGDSH